MRKITFIAITLFTTLLVRGQNNKSIDSMRQQLQTQVEDTSRVLTLRNISKVYMYIKPDSALLLAREALTLAKKINFKRGESMCMMTIANVFNLSGNYPKGLEYFLQALKTAEEINDKNLEAVVLSSMSDVYFYSGDVSRSISYSYRAIEAQRKQGNMIGMYRSMLNLGDTYEKIDRIDSALILTKAAYNFSLNNNYDNNLSYTIANLGNIYSKLNKADSAMAFYRLAIAGFDKENMEGVAEARLGMAKLFLKAGQTDSSLYYAKQSFAIAKEVGFTSHMMNASNFLAEYYRSARNVDSAYAYQSATIAAKDSLFSQQKANEIQSMNYEETMRLQQAEDDKEKATAALRQNALIGGLGTLLIVAFLLMLNNRQKKKANSVLEKTLSDLRSTQQQLVQSEKMASLGELTAGIAHEIQNPLNFVNNFSEVNKELIGELKIERQKAEGKRNTALEDDLIKDIEDNSEKINHHGKRADAIVKGMLQHSRSSTGQKEPTDINALCDEYLRLSYHGLRAKDKSFNADFKTDFDPSIGKVNIIPQDIGRVVMNLLTNAFYAVEERRKLQEASYKPLVTVSTMATGRGEVKIKITDNGNGIPAKVLDKIFQPFFTTKPTGQGTGLGLSLSYDIVKVHGGELKVETKEGEGTSFILELPA